MNLKDKHEQVLYPVVRVLTPAKSGQGHIGGSGTVIYSQPNPKDPEEYETFILTCEHVIHDAYEWKREIDTMLKRKVDKEFKKQVGVEIFDYVRMSDVNSSNSYRADIVAYDEHHDIALLKLDSPKRVQYVANVIPKNAIKDVKVFHETWTCGCSLLHDPFPNPGNVTYLHEMIENKLYWMGNGHSIFGNSGGAVFSAETGYQLGITARITGIQIGFGHDIMTWMGFFVAPQRLYEFFDEQELKFLYNPTDTYEKAMARRKAKEAAMKAMAVQQNANGEGGDDGAPEDGD
uniref:Putative trypsin-like peptidase domain containing protein n=1 Tax=viral metagenome TaxID=1070528 RepID=A0A6M3L204_9ZZZZ